MLRFDSIITFRFNLVSSTYWQSPNTFKKACNQSITSKAVESSRRDTVPIDFHIYRKWTKSKIRWLSIKLKQNHIKRVFAELILFLPLWRNNNLYSNRYTYCSGVLRENFHFSNEKWMKQFSNWFMARVNQKKLSSISGSKIALQNSIFQFSKIN